MGWKETLSLATQDKKKLFRLLILIIVAIILLLISRSLSGSQTVVEPVVTEATTADLCSEVEKKLTDALSHIRGAGTVSVVIMWEGSSEKNYGYNREKSTSGDEQKDLREEMVLLNNDQDAVVVQETLPDIQGVLIVATGAALPSVREELQTAAAIYLNIGTNRIQVSAGEGS